jgi:toxin ParE1/3/4
VSFHLLIEPEAEAELAKAFDWYEAQRPGLGQDFILCIEAALDAVRVRPETFPVILKSTRRALVRRFPYLILFTVNADLVDVVGVFHTSQNPSRWRKRAR